MSHTFAHSESQHMKEGMNKAYVGVEGFVPRCRYSRTLPGVQELTNIARP